MTPDFVIARVLSRSNLMIVKKDCFGLEPCLKTATLKGCPTNCMSGLKP